MKHGVLLISVDPGGRCVTPSRLLIGFRVGATEAVSVTVSIVSVAALIVALASSCGSDRIVPSDNNGFVASDGQELDGAREDGATLIDGAMTPDVTSEGNDEIGNGDVSAVRDAGHSFAVTLGGGGYDEFLSIAALESSVYLTGYSHSFIPDSTGIAWIARLGPFGDVVWQKRLDSTFHSKAVAVWPAPGGLNVLGSGPLDGSLNATLWSARVSFEGGLKSLNVYEGRDEMLPSSQHHTTDNGWIVTGYVRSSELGHHMWVIKLRSDGTVEWANRYLAIGEEMTPYSVTQTASSEFIVVGGSTTNGENGQIIERLLAIKLSQSGQVTWQRLVFGDGGDEGRAVIEDFSDGGYVVVGYRGAFGSGVRDLWLFKVSSKGDIEWQRTYTGNFLWDSRVSLARTSSGIVIAASWYEESQDAWLAEIGEKGDVNWNMMCGGPGTDDPTSMTVTPEGLIFVAGTTSDSQVYFDGLVFPVDRENSGTRACASTCIETNPPTAGPSSISISEADVQVQPFEISVTDLGSALLDTDAVVREYCGNETPPPNLTAASMAGHGGRFSRGLVDRLHAHLEFSSP